MSSCYHDTYPRTFVYNMLLYTMCILSTTVDSQSCINSNSSLPKQLLAHQTAYDTTSNSAYIFGGGTAYDSKTNKISPTSDTIYKWNITENVWNQLSVTTPTTAFVSYGNNAVTINDVVYFIGMYDGSYENDVDLFDLTTESWIDNTLINLAEYATVTGCVAHNNSHIFVVGGRSSSSTFIDKLQVYDIANNVWFAETIAIDPIQNNGWCCGYCYNVAANLYIFGGESNVGKYLHGAWRYNVDNKWRSIDEMPPIYAYGSAVYDAASDVILIVGGWEDVYIDIVYVFDVHTENITDIWRMTEKKSSVSPQIIESNLYIFGGETTDGAAVSTIEICNLPTIISSSTTFNPITTKLTSTAADYSTTAYKTTTTETITTESITDRTQSHASDTSSVEIESTSHQLTESSDILSTIQTSTKIMTENHHEDSREVDIRVITTIEDDDANNGSDAVVTKKVDWLLYSEIAVVLLLILMICVSGIYVMDYRKKKIKNEHDAAHIVQDDDKVIVRDANEEREEEEEAEEGNEVAPNSNVELYICSQMIITSGICGDQDNDDPCCNDDDEEQTDSSSHDSMYEKHQNPSGFETISGETNKDETHTNK